MFKILIDTFQYFFLILFNKHIRQQRKNPLEIPLIIINYNQLDNLKKLIDFMLDRNLKNIIIIDNNSSYPPLLEYYTQVPPSVIVERMSENHGHMVFFNSPLLQQKYGNGYFFLSDPDILPNKNLPANFAQIMIQKMDKYVYKIMKVGFALDLKTIPDYYPLKDKVLDWEKKFWDEELEKDVYYAFVDTTFALYKPQYPQRFKVRASKFYRAVRLAGDFTCQHVGWYTNPNKLTDEQQYYLQTSSISNTWKFDNEGKLDSIAKY